MYNDMTAYDVLKRNASIKMDVMFALLQPSYTLVLILTFLY